jgi:4,5-dihydroxyphthalate decarboxylase
MLGAKLTFTTGNRYDTKFLLDGKVKVEGVDIAVHDAGPAPWPVFRDMVTTISYDIGEQAFSHYLMAKDQGKPLTAIPAFPSRFFPQLGFTINRQSGIKGPSDLVGKRVGVAGFGYNPAAWLRGILTHQYDVPVEKIIWVEDSEDRFLKGLNYPRSRRFTVERAENLSQLLDEGKIDAIIPPGAGSAPTERTRKLFDDGYREVRSYLSATSVFPINTVITIKEEVVKAHPELPGRLMNAFHEARRLYQEEVASGKETNHMGIDTKALRELGLFPDQYDLEPNRAAVRMMIQYCYEQGLIRRLYEPEDLFVGF